MISIALAVVVNLITIAVVTGFQHEVRDKVSGFGSHILLMSSGENSIYESEPILKNQSFISEIKGMDGIASINYVAYKPVLFQSERAERTVKLNNGKDSTYTRQEIMGAVLKGIDNTYDLSFIRQNLKKGRLPRFGSDEPTEEVLISARMAKDLNLEVGDELNAFFVRNMPVKRKFVLAGIYETGLEEFDKKIAFGDLRIVQELNDWGIQATVEVADTLADGQLVIKAAVSGGNGNYRFNWGRGYENYAGFTLCPVKDTLIRVIVSDYWSSIQGKNEVTSIPDTAYLKVTVKGEAFSSCDFKRTTDGELIRDFLDEEGTRFSLEASSKKVFFESTPGNGSSQNYVGGFEVNVSDWNRLPEITEKLKKQFELIPTPAGESIRVSSIIDNQSDIFVWLSFLDLNVVIILTLMILIGIINMGSALLVLILVRTNFIGLMKAMGATNWSIRKIFLIQAGQLILRGMIIGNVIGLVLCGIQHYFGVLSLNPEVYYLNKVPVEIDLLAWALLNIGTFIVCVSALILPSIVITRISPIKAIRFN